MSAVLVALIAAVGAAVAGALQGRYAKRTNEGQEVLVGLVNHLVDEVGELKVAIRNCPFYSDHNHPVEL